MNPNPKWIRLTLDTPKVIPFAKWIWTEILNPDADPIIEYPRAPTRRYLCAFMNAAKSAALRYVRYVIIAQCLLFGVANLLRFWHEKKYETSW